jgi:hypothetical protein
MAPPRSFPASLESRQSFQSSGQLSSSQNCGVRLPPIQPHLPSTRQFRHRPAKTTAQFDLHCHRLGHLPWIRQCATTIGRVPAPVRQLLDRGAPARHPWIVAVPAAATATIALPLGMVETGAGAGAAAGRAAGAVVAASAAHRAAVGVALGVVPAPARAATRAAAATVARGVGLVAQAPRGLPRQADPAPYTSRWKIAC